MGLSIFKRLDYMIAILALAWIWIGFSTRDLYYDIFEPRIVPDGWAFNYLHEGIILMLSGIGTLIGIKNKRWSIAFFINVALFMLMIGNIALGITK